MKAVEGKAVIEPDLKYRVSGDETVLDSYLYFKN